MIIYLSSYLCILVYPSVNLHLLSEGVGFPITTPPCVYAWMWSVSTSDSAVLQIIILTKLTFAELHMDK